MTTRHFERLDITTGEVGKGDLFIGPEGLQLDLKNVNVLWTGVDTVRQLFQGRLKKDLLALIAHECESGHDATITLNRIPFRLMSGRRGGGQIPAAEPGIRPHDPGQLLLRRT